MTTTAKLGIPLISGQQAQPEVTHNTAVIMLQALALGAIRRTNNPPGSPGDGDTYIVGEVPTGAWVGHANRIATFLGGWVFIPGVDSNGGTIAMGTEQEGLTIYCREFGGMMTWSGFHWYVTNEATSS